MRVREHACESVVTNVDVCISSDVHNCDPCISMKMCEFERFAEVVFAASACYKTTINKKQHSKASLGDTVKI